MPYQRMPITPELVKWARKRAGYKLHDLASKSKFRKIEEWENGVLEPTYRQLEDLANTLKVPIAVFFFPKPPELTTIEETFRTLGSEQIEEIPPGIRLLLHKARALQLGLAELNDGRNPVERQIIREMLPSLDGTTAEVALRVRDTLEISLQVQFSWKDADTAFKAWRKALYGVGIAVFKDAFQDDYYCGFSLYDNEFPIIYVNNSNTHTRQVFTLFHELAHLLFRTSGVDKIGDFLHPLPDTNYQIEAQCNRLAAEILVPRSAFDRELRHVDSPESQVETLADKFCVSREVISRKLLDRGTITTDAYQEAAKTWSHQRAHSKSGGGNYYRNIVTYLGDEYISLAFRRFYQNRIGEEELADYLDIPPKNIDRLVETFFGERQ